MQNYKPLTDLKIVTLALNLPGPFAAKRLLDLGATVIKIEPPTGDPLVHYSEKWYQELNKGQQILSLDIKSGEGKEELAKHLDNAALLLTAQRPAALERLGLDWKTLHDQHPQLNHLAIVGYPSPKENLAGHDLTYQASFSLLNPPHMPKALLADMTGGEQAATQALGLLMGYKAGQEGAFCQIALSDAVEYMAQAANYGLTDHDGILGGKLPEYSIYETKTGWIAIAALEPHFRKSLIENLELEELSKESLERIFKERSSSDWVSWADERDIPLAEIK